MSKFNSSNMNNCKHVIPKPRIDIVDTTKFRSKTLVITNGIGCETDMDKSDVNTSILNATKYDDLQNGTIFFNDHNNPISEGFVNIHRNENRVVNEKSGTIFGVDKSVNQNVGRAKLTNRRSLFSNIMRRLSTLRSKPHNDIPQSLSQTEPVTAAPNLLQSSSCNNRTLRRWFTRRILKFNRHTDSGKDSQQSLSIEKTILETNCKQLDGNNVADASQVLRTAPMPRKHLFWHHSTKQYFNSTEILRSNENIKELSSPCKSYSSQLFALNNQKDLISPANSTKSVRTQDYNIYPSQYADCSTSEAEIKLLNRVGTDISLSEVKLPVVSDYTPSYLNASLAAFGYSNYSLKSKSAHSLVNNSVGPSSSHLQSGTLPCSKLTFDTAINCGFRQRIDKSNVDSGSINFLPDDKFSDCENANVMRKSTPKYRCFKAHALEYDDSRLDVSTDNVELRQKRTTNHSQISEDQEHWQRSSLIMLAVAHASPRGRPTTPIGGSSTTAHHPLANVSDSAGLIMNTSLMEECDDHHHPSVTVDDSVNFGSISQKQPEPVIDESIKSVSILAEPAVELESMVLKNNDDRDRGVNGNCNGDAMDEVELKVDGRHYLAQVDQTEAELVELINATELDLKNNNDFLDDEVAGLLRTACGKAKLLVSDKFVQFRGLCHENLLWEESNRGALLTSETEHSKSVLITLVSDLEGFWAMISLQVDDIRNLFGRVNELRLNHWKPLTDSSNSTVVGNGMPDCDVITNGMESVNVQSKKMCTPRKSVSKQKELLARSEARKRLNAFKNEQRNKTLACAAPTNGFVHSEDDVMIFI